MTDPYTPPRGVTDPDLVAMSTISHQLAEITDLLRGAAEPEPKPEPEPAPEAVPEPKFDRGDAVVVPGSTSFQGPWWVTERTWIAHTASGVDPYWSYRLDRPGESGGSVPENLLRPFLEPEPDEDREFAQSIAEYVQTATVWESWSKEDVARETVLVILGDESAGHRALDLLRRKVPAADLIDREAAIAAVRAARDAYVAGGWDDPTVGAVRALRALPGVTP